MYLQLYNGDTYDTWCDLADYATFQNNTWCYFEEVITQSQYLKADFRLRFDSSGLADNGEYYRLDDVLIEMKDWTQ